MIKIIRKNQKVVGVVLGVLLMLMFLKGLAPQGSEQSAQFTRQVATLDGAKVTQLQLNSANAEWQLLQELDYVDPNHPDEQPMRLVAAYPGVVIANEIEKAQSAKDGLPLYFLLWKEAERQGVVVTPEELNSVLTNNVSPNNQPGTDEAVLHALEIRHLADLQDGVVKISRPYRDYQLAMTAQDLTLKVAPIVAAAYTNAVGNPTDADIQKQYDAFSNRVAAVPGAFPSDFGSADDPLGFGYKTPNRVTLEYIGLNYADVAQTAKASKSMEDWYIAAFGDFKANRDDYDSRPLPSTQPSAEGQTSSPRKLDDIEQDFALHAPLVLEKLYDDATKTLLQNVVKELNEKLSAGYGTYRDTVASGGSATTGPAAAYLSFNFLSNLADSIHAKFGVSPILGNIRQFKSGPELLQIPGIGQSKVIESNANIPFFAYATQLYLPWISQADKGSALGSLAISQWQPSNALADANNNIYFFRISGADASHLPPLADVKEQVIADWKLAAAYAKAQDAAKALLASANRIGLDKAAEAAHVPVIPTDPFEPFAIASGQSAPVISPLQLGRDSALELAKTAQNLLSTPESASGHRQLLTNLYADSTVAVIQLESATPIWKSDPDYKSIFSVRVAASLSQMAQAPLEKGLFAPDLVKARMGYVAMDQKSN